MLFWILASLQIIFGIVAGESTIRQTSEGGKTIDVLSKSGLFFLRWRAFSDYKKELTGLQKIFGITAIIFTVLLFSIGPSNPPSLFNALPGLFLVLWLTMQFGTNFKKSVKEQASMAGLMVIGPWLILGMDYITEFQFNQLRLMASPFKPFGLLELETYQIAIALSLVGCFKLSRLLLRVSHGSFLYCHIFNCSAFFPFSYSAVIKSIECSITSKP